MVDFKGFEYPFAPLATMSRCLVGNGTGLDDLSFKPRLLYTIEEKRPKHQHDITICIHEL